jgi:hypothetical protein
VRIKILASRGGKGWWGWFSCSGGGLVTFHELSDRSSG